MWLINCSLLFQDVLWQGGKKETVMKNTIKGLPVTLTVPLLTEVCWIFFISYCFVRFPVFCCIEIWQNCSCKVDGFIYLFVFLFIFAACSQDWSHALEVSIARVSILSSLMLACRWRENLTQSLLSLSPSEPICAFLHYFKFSCLRKQPTFCIATTGSTLMFGSETSTAAMKSWLFPGY